MNASNQSILQNETFIFNNTERIANKTGIFIMWSIGTITCIMNAIVIFALLKANVLRENTHKVLVLSLSFSDFLSGIGAILYGIDLLTHRTVNWPFFLILYSVFVSLSQIFLLCIEAYLSVCASFVYKEKVFGGYRKYLVIAIIWLINLLYYSMLYFSVSDVNAGFVSPVACISFSIVYVLTASFYIKTLHKIRSSKRKIDLKRENGIKAQVPSNRNLFSSSSNVVETHSKFEKNGINPDNVRSKNVMDRSSANMHSEPSSTQKKNTRNIGFCLGDKAGCHKDQVPATKQERHFKSYHTNQQTMQPDTKIQGKRSKENEISVSAETSFSNENKEMNKNANGIEYDLPNGSNASNSTPCAIKNENRPQKKGGRDTRRHVGFKNITWHRRSTITIGLILLVITVSCVPFILLTMLFSLNVPYLDRTPIHYSGMLMLLNGIINPVIYVVRIREFRNLQWLRF